MSVAQIIREEMGTNEFWAGIAKFEFTLSINKVMEEKNISKSELARRIGKSPAYITKVMSGDCNLTIGSMVMIARAIGMKFSTLITDEPIAERASNVISIQYKPYVESLVQVRNYG